MNWNKALIVTLFILLMVSLAAQDVTHTMESRRDLRSANMYFGQRNFDRAYDLYNSVLELDPDYLTIFELAELSNYTYLLFDIEKNYRKAFDLAGQVVEQCQAILDEYEELEETDSRAARRFHRANIRNQNIEGVLENNQRIRESSWVRMLQTGQRQKDEGNFDEAITALQELYELTPDSTIIAQLIAATYIDKNEPEKASEYFRKIHERNPNDLVVIEQLAVHHYNQGEFLKAADWYQKAAAIESDNANHYFNAAISYNSTESPEKALEMFEKSVEVEPTYLEAIINAGIVAQQLGKTDVMIQYLKQAFELDSTEVSIVIQLTYALYGQEEYEQVKKYATKWKELNPESEDAQNMITAAEHQLRQQKK